MIPETILRGMEEFAETDKYHGAMWDTITTLVNEVRRLKNIYEPEVSMDGLPENEHDKMYSCKFHTYVDDMADTCSEEHNRGFYSIDAPEDSDYYNPLWDVCKTCRYWVLNRESSKNTIMFEKCKRYDVDVRKKSSKLN